MRIVYYASEDNNKASTRLRCCLPAQQLRLRGYDAVVSKQGQGDLFVIQKLSTPNISHLKGTIVWDVCDATFLNKKETEMSLNIAKRAKCVTVPNEAMRHYVKANLIAHNVDRPVHVVPDPHFYPSQEPSFLENRNVIKMLWYGNAKNLNKGDWDTEVFQPIFEKYIMLNGRNVELKIMTRLSTLARYNFKMKPGNVKVEFVEWDLNKQSKYCHESDFTVFPISPNEYTAQKSHNKLIDSFMCGTMVIANPLQSYLPYKKYAGLSGNLFNDMLHCLTNKEETLQRIRSAQEYVEKNYSPSRVADKWEEVLLNEYQN